MKTLQIFIKYFPKWFHRIIIAPIIFKLIFRKISKKQFGRCLTCSASVMCVKYNYCACSDDEQYEIK